MSSGRTSHFTSSFLHSSSLCRSRASVASTCWRCLSRSLSHRCCSCRCWDCSLWKLASSSLCRARVRCFSCSRSTFPLWRPGREARSVSETRCSSMWLSCWDMMAWRRRQWQEENTTTLQGYVMNQWREVKWFTMLLLNKYIQVQKTWISLNYWIFKRGFRE